MSSTWILITIIVVSAVLLSVALRNAAQRDVSRAIQAISVALLAGVSLAIGGQGLLFGVTVTLAAVFFLGPPLMLRWGRMSGPLGAWAIPLIRVFWWGADGRALRDMTRAQRAMARGELELAEVLIAHWEENVLPPLARDVFFVTVARAALAAGRWTQVLRIAREASYLPAVRLASARAMAELGRPADTLQVLCESVNHPAIAQFQGPLLDAELAAYATAGDLLGIDEALSRRVVGADQVPTGWSEYWRGRCLIVQGERSSGRIALRKAHARIGVEHPHALQKIDGYLEGTEPIVASAPDAAYSKAKREYLRRLKTMNPWFTFLGGREVAPVITAMWILCILVALIPLFPGQQGLYTEWFDKFCNHSSKVIEGGQYYRLFTANFLHANADGFVHLGFNLVALALFGAPVERSWGSLVTLLVLLASGIGGHAVGALWSGSGVEIRAIGASTAVFGILALYALSFVRYQAPGLDEFRTRRFILLLSLIGLDIVHSIMVNKIDMVHKIDTVGHVGGLIIGAVIGLFFVLPTLIKRKKSTSPRS